MGIYHDDEDGPVFQVDAPTVADLRAELEAVKAERDRYRDRVAEVEAKLAQLEPPRRPVPSTPILPPTLNAGLADSLADGFASVAERELAAERDRYLTRACVAEARARWIPVGERMPDPHIPVLGWAHTRVSYCVWQPNLWISYGYGAPISVTHWMPLPHPPKETP